MIWDSAYWKDDLLERATYLSRRKYRKGWSELSLARLEQTVMLGFYSIRKLVEACKLSDATFKQRLPISSYRCRGKDVTLMNWNRIDELYHLDSPNAENRDVLFLCHQVVHSYVFMPLLDDRQRLVGILFASDRQRHVSLLQLTINQVIDLFRQVGKDYPSQMTGKFSTEKRDFEFVSGIEPNLDVRCQGRLLTTSSKT